MSKSVTEKQSDIEKVTLEAKGVHYRDLNQTIRDMVDEGYKEIVLNDVNGQRYIGDGLIDKINITINGVPGNDLGAFMDGPTIVVNDNAQDGVGNTMNSGKIVIKGHAGDVLGYGMRGGKVFVRGDVGYRVGIHMKSYKDQVPVIVAGGRAGDFFGEYMAGGILVLLGIGSENGQIAGQYLATGMHGGMLYMRARVEDGQIGREVHEYPLDEADEKLLEELLDEFCGDTGIDRKILKIKEFVKLMPSSHRPYGDKYVY